MSTIDNVFIDKNKRLFYISDEIDNSSIGVICFNLLCILREDDNKEKEQKNFKREPISIYINSNGGFIRDMWGLIDIIEKSKTPIYTYCTGYAMSAAFFIFISGHKRFASRHATFLYHQMHLSSEGKYQDLVESREETDFMNEELEEYIIENTKFSQTYIDKIRERKKDVFIHSEDALKYGIVDLII